MKILKNVILFFQLLPFAFFELYPFANLAIEKDTGYILKNVKAGSLRFGQLMEDED